MEERNKRERTAFLLAMAEELHACGIPAHRIEGYLEEIALRLGLTARFFAMPTSLAVHIGPLEEQRSHFIRAEAGPVDLGRLHELRCLTLGLLAGQLRLEEARARLDALRETRSGPPHLLRALAAALAAAGAAGLWAATWPTVACAALIGLWNGVLTEFADAHARVHRGVVAVAAFSAALAATGAGAIDPRIDPGIALLSGIIVLLPGLSLTLAMRELAEGHLLAGSARMAGSMLTLLQIGFGCALALRVPWAPIELPTAGGAPTLPLAAASLVVSTVALGILYRARFRDLWVVGLGVASAAAGTALGHLFFGSQLAGFCGALLLGMVGNLLALRGARPASTAIVPGLIPLVPGSIGARGVLALLSSDIGAGVDQGFGLLFAGVSLAMGLLLANWIIPTRPDIRQLRAQAKESGG